jgi:hypothetical protein
LIDELISNSKSIEEDQILRIKECKQKEMQARESMQIIMSTMKLQINSWN